MQSKRCNEHWRRSVATDTKRCAVRAAVLECCRAWEPQARVLGNVTAEEIADLLEHVVTAADKAVLDAMGDISECDLRWTLEMGDIDADGNDTPAVRACRAELARRGAK